MGKKEPLLNALQKELNENQSELEDAQFQLSKTNLALADEKAKFHKSEYFFGLVLGLVLSAGLFAVLICNGVFNQTVSGWVDMQSAIGTGTISQSGPMNSWMWNSTAGSIGVIQGDGTITIAVSGGDDSSVFVCTNKDNLLHRPANVVFDSQKNSYILFVNGQNQGHFETRSTAEGIAGLLIQSQNLCK